MTNQQLGHAFVYASMTENGNASNFSFNGNVLYSYSSILCVKNEGYFIISEPIAHYSNSSSKHHNHLTRAIPNMDKVIYLNRTLSYDETLKSIDINDLKNSVLEPIKDLLLKQSRARKYSYFDSINRLIKKGFILCEHGSIDKRSKVYKEFIKLAHSDIEKDYIELIEAHKKEEEKRKKKIAKQRYEKNLKYLENFTGVSMKDYTPSQIDTFDFLCIKEDKLCTNRGVCVDLQEANILYKRLVSNKDIIGAKIGYYTILNKNDKFVTIGCHKILIKELKRVLSWLR